MVKKYLLFILFIYMMPISSNVFAVKLVNYRPSFFMRQISEFYTSNKRPMDDEERREFIELVKEGRLPIDQLNQDGYSTIMLAAQVNDLEVVRFLLNKTNINEKNKGITPLHMAAKSDAIAVVALLIKEGADLEAAAEDFNNTPIIIAAGEGCTRVVRLLIDAGADFDKPSLKGNTAIMRAAFYGKDAVVEILLEAYAHRASINSHAHSALSEVNSQEEKSPLDHQNENGDTAVTYASCQGHPQTLRQLIDAHANIHHVRKHGDNALILAASANFGDIVKAGHVAAVKMLIDAKANLNLQDKNGETALMWAAYKGHAEIVLMLLSAGADSTLKNKNGRTALKAACAQNKKAAETILRYWDAISEEGVFNKFLEAKSEIWQRFGQEIIPPALSRFLEARGASLYVEEQIRLFKSKKLVSTLCFCCQHEVSLAEEEILGQGPSGCSCVVCPECKPGFIRHQLENCGLMDLICPQCKITLDPHFFDKAGCTAAEVFKIGKTIVDQTVSQQPGWKYCKTPDCRAGRIVGESESPFFSCPICDFQGCLTCGQNHRGECRQAMDEEKATGDHMDFLLEQGSLAPPEAGHPADPNHPDYYRGRYRPCYFCGTIAEKPYDGIHHAGQCNGMVCLNPQCKKKWHWNHGGHERHPNNQGNFSEIHDFKLEPRSYEPLEKPHF